jgi:hypothetical protein
MRHLRMLLLRVHRQQCKNCMLLEGPECGLKSQDQPTLGGGGGAVQARDGAWINIFRGFSL